MRVGLISDTHGRLRAEALRALAGVELILHAGDIGDLTIVPALERLAPTHVVRGNVDPGEAGWPERLDLTLEGVRIHVSHGHELGSPTPERLIARYDADVIVYGHTHRPLVETHGGRLVVNPGSAGARRFHLRPTIALMAINAGEVSAEIVVLNVAP